MKTKPWPVVQTERRYEFHAEHSLPLSSNPKAKIRHLHVYHFWIICKHEINPNTDWMAKDFDEIDDYGRSIVEILDGQNLNSLMRPVPPTSEALAIWILKNLPGWVDAIKVQENPNSTAEVWRKWINRAHLGTMSEMYFGNPAARLEKKF